MTAPGAGRFGAPPRPARGASQREPVAGSFDRGILWILLLVHGALLAALAIAGWTLLKYLPGMPLTSWQKAMFEIGIAAAFLAFSVRAALLVRRLRRPPTR